MRKGASEERSRNLWWWNEQVKDAIDRKKTAFKLWYTNRSVESKNNYYRTARNETKRVIAKVMKQEAEEMNVLCTKPNDVFKFAKFIGKEGRLHEVKDGRLAVSEKDRGKLWKEHMEKIMNVENE